MSAVSTNTTPLLEPVCMPPFQPATPPPATPYVLPTPSAYQEWKRHALRDFVPTERQRQVIAAVQAALDAQLFYSDEVLAFCAQQLCPTSAQTCVNAKKVVGGEFGMDCYYARGYLRSQEQFKAEDAAHQKLAPHIGMHLGTLVFDDYKRNTGMVIEEILVGGRLKLRGKRGARVVICECTALQIAGAVDRAAERRLRKDRFDTFTSV